MADLTPTQKQANRAVATVRRHPLSFGSLLSTVPIVIFLSLLSVVFCPPPPAPPSTISRIALSPFGLHQPSPYSELHQTLCYPSNLYHENFLRPYIYPRLENTRQKVIAHPVYSSIVEPGYQVAKSTSGKVWRGPIRPIVSRVDRGARKFYLTFIEPHLPYLRKRIYTLTHPYTSRLSDGWKTHVSPRVDIVSKHAKMAYSKTSETGRYIATHPVSKTAVVYGDKGSKIAAARAKAAYVWIQPRAHKFALEAERVGREVLGPKALQGLDLVARRAVHVWSVLKV